MHRKWLCIPTAIACLFAQAALARNIFVTSGDYSTSVVATFSSDPLIFGTNIGGLGGAFKVLPSASPTKYYVISKSGTETVTVLDGRFPNLVVGRRISIMQDATAAEVTPDRRRLLVVGPAGLQIIDTANELSLVLAGNLDVGTEPIDVAASIDSTRAFVLSARSTKLTAIDLTTNQIAGSIQIGTTPSSVTVGPNGVVYVSAQNAIYEIDGYTMQARRTIGVSGQPGKLVFTPDGKFALARNESVFSGRGAFSVDLARGTASESISTGISYRDMDIVDDRTAYAVGTNGVVYQITIASDGSLSTSAAQFTGGPLSDVREIAITNELPRGKFLIVLTPARVQRVELDTNTVSADYAATGFTGNLSLVAPPTTGGFSSFLSYNASPIVAPGTSSQPLVIRVYDQAGRPISGIPVTFATTAAGVTLTSPSTSSNFEGYASTRVNIPATLASGTVEVMASIAGGARTTQFTITIGDPGLGGGTPGGGTGTPVPRGLQIIAGHGQVVSEYFTTAFQEPLTVRLTNDQGQPIAGARILWRLAQGSGNVNPSVSTTNELGVATSNFSASGVTTGPATPFLTNSITAEVEGASQAVTFFVTTLPRIGDQFGSISALMTTPGPIRVKAGSVNPGAIQARVSTERTGYPVPFVGMRIFSTSPDPTITQPAECRGTYALSDATGLISCDVVAGRTLGTFGVYVLIGSRIQHQLTLEVVPGDPSRVFIYSGGTQAANPGSQFSPLVVQVTDEGGNPLPGVQVDWDIPQSVGIVNIQRVTDETGRATLTLAAGQTAGPVTVRARSGTGVATFNLSIRAIASTLTKLDGDNQSAIVGQQFQKPVSVRVVDAQNQPLNGAVVTFTVAGPATVASSSVTTGPDGVASTTVTAGNIPGAVTITATSGSASTTFSLTTRLAGPAFTANDVLDGFGYQPGVSPGSIAYIRGRGIATDVRGTVTPGTLIGPLPTQLANVEVLFNNVPAPIFAVSNINGEESVVVQVPFEVQPGPAAVTIRSAGGGATTVNNVNILPLKPGVSTFRDVNGSIYATATRPDGSYVSSSNPARRGELIRVYATGLGQTSPATGTNRVGQVGQRVIANVIAGINHAGVRVVSAELLPGTVGVYMITVEVPADTTPGTHQPFGLAVEGPDGQAVFANGTAIPIL